MKYLNFFLNPTKNWCEKKNLNIKKIKKKCVRVLKLNFNVFVMHEVFKCF